MSTLKDILTPYLECNCGPEGKRRAEIEIWIRNHENARKTSEPSYLQPLDERASRAQEEQKLDFGRSLEHLKQTAIDQTCTSYGELAKANGVGWSTARHQMNGPSGHLDRLLDICHARGLPLLTAICVNQDNTPMGSLGKRRWPTSWRRPSPRYSRN